MITKVRGDVTLKTEFISKEIREIVRRLAVETLKLEGLLKLVPAIG